MKINENFEKYYKIVQQNSADGIQADEIARKLGRHRTTIYRYLSHLSTQGKVESRNGLWYAKTEQTTIKEQPTDKPLEKEIVIELPLPKNKWQYVAILEAHSRYLERLGLPSTADIERTFVEKFNETRTIRIRGKNVDDIDLEKIGNLIQQASQKSSLFGFKGLFKGLRKSLPNSTTINSEKCKDADKSSET